MIEILGFILSGIQLAIVVFVIIVTIGLCRRLMKARLIFAWYDFWVGLFWDQKKKVLYIFPFPMVGIKVEFSNGI